MKMQHKTGVGIMVIGGILMIASYTGGTIKVFEFIYDLIVNQWPQSQQIASIILDIFQWIADLGGIAIIIGAILILFGAMRIGKFVAWIGLAFGTFALIVWVVAWIVNLTGIITDPTIVTYLNQLYAQFNYGSSLSFIGVVIAIIGRIFVRRTKKEKPIAEEPIIEATYSEDEENIKTNLDTKFCPNCGTELPVYANFCNNCGETFN
jgi:ABC-type multidrug transport system fused ATPase/permease subunit